MTMHRPIPPRPPRGGAAVAALDNVPDLEAGAVLYLRLFCEGQDGQAKILSDFSAILGDQAGGRAAARFCELCLITINHGRRPMMLHQRTCKCIGADESVFANLIAVAAGGDHEDAALMASLIVRTDMAFGLAALATEVGFDLHKLVRKGQRLTVQPTAASNKLH